MKIIFLCLCLSLASASVVIDPFGDLGACGEDQPRYINTSGVVFRSPNFGAGQQYPPNQDCTWLIEYTGDDEETSVKVEFSTFVLEDCTNCACDYVEAYEGSSTEDPVLGRHCGNSALDLSSEGRTMLLRFVSDASTEFQGFTALNSFAVLPPPYCVSGGSPIEITDPEGEISSPGYPESYPDNLDCKWLISTPGATGYRLEFEEEFGTENCCLCDYLEIYSGTSNTLNDIRRGRWYGTHYPYVFEMEGPDLYINFRSDSSVSGSGFGFSYTAMYN
jgi:predicted nucleic-acid-binding Zn-ribbon protein